MTTVLIVTGSHPASVQVSQSHEIRQPKRRGWENSSIEHFIASRSRREFTLGENGRIEVHELPEGVADLIEYDRLRVGAVLSPSTQLVPGRTLAPIEAGVAVEDTAALSEGGESC